MNTPKIRFKGFKDDWEQRKVLDLLVQPVTDGPHETPRLVENGIPFISVDAIVDNKIDFSRKRGDVSEEYDAECCKKYKPQYHDVYVVKSGSTVGKVAIVETTDRFNIWSPLAALRCEGKTKPYYLFYLLQTRRMQAQILDKASNGTQPNLSMRELEKFDVLVTDNAEEQQRIGDYFKSLDHLITLHQRKCDETKQLKKFMLQKMFPKNGEKNPEIRFEGFTDDWEQRKLIEVCDYVDYRGKTPTKVDNGIFLVTAKNVKAGYIDYESSKEYISEDDYEEVMHRGKPEIGDVLITTEAPCGNVAQVNTSNIALAQRIIKYRGHKNVIDNTYLKHYMLAPYFQKILFEKSSGGTVQGIKGSILHQQHIIYPMYDEQLKIGEYFDSLDDLITLHQRKCEKLKELKKFMLQNIFV